MTQFQNQTGTEDWKKPINFYGKVVDENINPIAGANIGFVWNDISPTGAAHASTTSDASGSFSLTGVAGRGLNVNVEKIGYYYVKHLNQNSFEYARDYEANFHRPDANNPVVFHLRKKGSGTELITSQYGVFPDLEFSSPKDGTPVRVDFFNRKVGSDGQLEISQIKPAYESWKTATQWWYHLAIPDGGFVEHHDEFPFEAPDTGYQSVVEFTFNQGQPNWATRLSKDYYVVFGNPRRYGRIHIETSISTGTVLTYAINPAGSRNLEPK